MPLTTRLCPLTPADGCCNCLVRPISPSLTISCTKTSACSCQVLQRMQISCHLKPTPITRMNQKTQHPKVWHHVTHNLSYPQSAWSQQAQWLGHKGYGIRGTAQSLQACRSVLVLMHASSIADCPSRRHRRLHSITPFLNSTASKEADHATHNKGSVHTCWRAPQLRHMHKGKCTLAACALSIVASGPGCRHQSQANPRHRRLHHRITSNLSSIEAWRRCA